MNQKKEETEEGNKRLLLNYIKEKYPGLTVEAAHTIITRVKKANGGILLGLSKKKYITTIKTVMKAYFCEKSKKEKEDLKEARMEKAELESSCPFCFKIFASKFSCSRHVRFHHSDERASQEKLSTNSVFDKKCPVCEKHFKYDWSLHMHVKAFHSEEEITKAKDFETLTAGSSGLQCSICNKLFTQRSDLKRHLRTHNSDAEKFKCDQCGELFNRKDNLVKHEQRLHNIVNINVDLLKKSCSESNKCKMCGVSFEKQKAFEHHIVYKVCQTSQDMKMVEVNMDKRFECNQCEKSYYDIDSLSRHVRWKHTLPTRTCECTDCDLSFKLKSSLVRHQRKKHPENDD